MSTILQLAGAGAVTAGVSLLSVPAGLIIGGLFAILIGVAVSR